ncbi:hypothetical protein ABIC83_002900 [Roseateles asaccharophilus]|uniref:hypothetical protein n=1 Tax=Roseateles asaccharophilus TaxID=582607 RepID=UPI003834092F
MSATFEPQSVPPSSWKLWLSESLSLVTARWFPQAAVSATFMFTFAVLPIWARVLFGPLAAGLAVGLAAVIAHATDLRRPTLGALRDAVPGLVRLSLSVLALQGVAMLMFGVGSSSLKGFSAYESIEAAGDFIGGQWALWFLLVGWGMSMPRDFFLIPLLCCAGMPYIAGGEMSDRGVKKNSYVWHIRIAAMGVCFVALLIHGLCAILLLPLSGGFLYVAYKHVYLGEAPKLDLAPAPAPVAIASEPLRGS